MWRLFSIVLEEEIVDYITKGIIDQGNESKRVEFIIFIISNISSKDHDKKVTSKTHVVYGIVTTGYHWEFIWCSCNSEGKLCWGYNHKIDPIEMSLKKSYEHWKNRVKPLLEILNYIIKNALEKL